MSSLPVLPQVLAGLSVFSAWRNLPALLSLHSIGWGTVLALTDQHLWEMAPSHGYALLGFIQVDLAVLFLMTARRALGAKLVTIWGSLQVVLLAGDLLSAPSLGVTYEHLFWDLYRTGTFEGLLFSRVLQALHLKLLPRTWLV